MSASLKLSLRLQDIAHSLADILREVAGEPIAFVLVLSSDKNAQYVSNASRVDGTEMIESLLSRWKANRADIPAHYNPDLSAALAAQPAQAPVPVFEVGFGWVADPLKYQRGTLLYASPVAAQPAQPTTTAPADPFLAGISYPPAQPAAAVALPEPMIFGFLDEGGTWVRQLGYTEAQLRAVIADCVADREMLRDALDRLVESTPDDTPARWHALEDARQALAQAGKKIKP